MTSGRKWCFLSGVAAVAAIVEQNLQFQPPSPWSWGAARESFQRTSVLSSILFIMPGYTLVMIFKFCALNVVFTFLLISTTAPRTREEQTRKKKGFHELDGDLHIAN